MRERFRGTSLTRQQENVTSLAMEAVKEMETILSKSDWCKFNFGIHSIWIELVQRYVVAQYLLLQNNNCISYCCLHFRVLEECRETCETKPVNVCEQPKVVGPCEALIPRYFYNKSTKKCEFFYYGGCSANGNNFEYVHEFTTVEWLRDLHIVMCYNCCYRHTKCL